MPRSGLVRFDLRRGPSDLDFERLLRLFDLMRMADKEWQWLEDAFAGEAYQRLHREPLPHPPQLSHPLYKVKEAAIAAGVSETTLRRAIAKGDLEVLRPGRSIRITDVALRTWLRGRAW